MGSIGAAAVVRPMRVFNGSCYLVSGVLFLILLATGGGAIMPWWAWLVGIGATVYGSYVLFTKGSYIVNAWTYLGPLFLICWALQAILT